MSVQTIEFAAFGVQYRTTTFTAVKGLAIFGSPGEIHPLTMFEQTDVKTAEGAWAPLSVKENVNEYVRDCLGVIAPISVMRGLIGLVNEKNFGFIRGWKGIKIPKRFTSGAQTVHSAHSDPLIQQIVQEGMATLRELEEYYSLEDAFRMFDMSMAKGLNEALSNEAATKKSSRR